MIWNVLIVKITVTVFLIVPGWIPETCLVEPPQTKNHQDDLDWMNEYRKYALEAFIAGLLMCGVSRLSHILAKPSALHHEAYMSTYAYLAAACLMPLLTITELKSQQAKRKEMPDESSYPMHVKVIGALALVICSIIKNFYLDRIVMQRYVRDYDPETHEKMPSWRIWQSTTNEEQNNVVIEDPAENEDVGNADGTNA